MLSSARTRSADLQTACWPAVLYYAKLRISNQCVALSASFVCADDNLTVTWNIKIRIHTHLRLFKKKSTHKNPTFES